MSLMPESGILYGLWFIQKVCFRNLHIYRVRGVNLYTFISMKCKDLLHAPGISIFHGDFRMEFCPPDKICPVFLRFSNILFNPSFRSLIIFSYLGEILACLGLICHKRFSIQIYTKRPHSNVDIMDDNSFPYLHII